MAQILIWTEHKTAWLALKTRSPGNHFTHAQIWAHHRTWTRWPLTPGAMNETTIEWDRLHDTLHANPDSTPHLSST